MSKKFKSLFLLSFIFLWTKCFSKPNEEPKCSLQDTCSSCIRQPGCVWCNSDTMVLPAGFLRCINENERNENSKLCTNIVNPKMNVTVLQNDSISIGKNVVQISPQKIQLRLRRGQKYEFNLNYAQAADYPVDLYYIMDLSGSMLPHKNKLSALGTTLANTMKKLTKNFRLGFGSFVEKPIMPFVPRNRLNPCIGSYCDYVFKNHLKLDDNSNLFSQEIKNAALHYGGDEPEAGLDALMQAIVCQQQIGWRRKARHLLVFSTDASYHIAGDGKVAGIVMPHDCKCHMENNMYTHGLVFDFPTIAQINRKAIEHEVNIIFAVTEYTKNDYMLLEKQIKDSSVGIITHDSSNIIELIKGIYNKIVDSVKISDNSDGEIEVKYYSKCTGNKKEETNQCDNLHVGVQVDFTVVINVLECPKDGQNKKMIYIKPNGLNEGVTVEIEILCNCDCDTPGHKYYIANATDCSYQGHSKCGVCDCFPGKLGLKCECDKTDLTSIQDTRNCRPDNTSDLCSGQGTCKCNKCNCHTRSNPKEQIYGKFCECNNYSCKRNRNKICSGEERGLCKCGKCRCFAGYTGDACECPDNNSTCISPLNNKICFGRGICDCGECKCIKVDDKMFTGQYCDECYSCPGSRCLELRNCVECLLFNSGIYNKNECVNKCTKYEIEQIDIIDEKHLKPNEKLCVYPDADGCYFTYKYSYGKFNEINIIAQKDKVCSDINVLAMVCIIIGSILLGGIILLIIWKSITTYHDKKEYAKFDEERKKSKWDQGTNPLFKNPTAKYKNPTFDETDNISTFQL